MSAQKSSKGRHFREVEPTSEQVSFSRLVFQAIPELWTFQIVIPVIIGALGWGSGYLYGLIVRSANVVLTSANLGEVLAGWRGPMLTVLATLIFLIVIVIEIFALILFCDDILCGRRAKVFGSIQKGLSSIKRFLNPAGILVLAYVLLAPPLCGVGFSVSVTRDLYVPHFVSEVIEANRLYNALYIAALVILAIVGFIYIFVIHGVLIDDLSPLDAMRQSRALITKNWLSLLKASGTVVLGWGLAIFIVALVFRAIPDAVLKPLDSAYDGVEFSFQKWVEDPSHAMTDEQFDLITYRSVCSFVALSGGYLVSILSLLASSHFMLRFTRFYRDHVYGESESWPSRKKRFGYVWKLIGMIGTGIIIVFMSVLMGLMFDLLLLKPPVGVIGHRAAGTLAPENSLEGLEVAIEHQCMGSEIDVQRTSDGYYVINHDDTFRRLAGVDRSPKDMTFDEVRSLYLKDTTGSDRTLQVPTLEEMLDIIKDRELLFIELKGSTADKQMVDDVVAMVREKGCVDDVVLISLNYNVIQYAEETYPEFETGTLIFMGLGDVSSLKCDYVLMEEEAATHEHIGQLHAAGKKAGVWTVNTEEGMRKILASDADVVITDEILLAQQVQTELDARSDSEIINDTFANVWR